MKQPWSEARELARRLAKHVDEQLKEPRDSIDPPSDGQIAAMAMILEIERLGYKLVRMP
jgi:hypothetical protein